MKFGVYLMKKVILVVVLLLVSIYLGYKIYLISEIKSVVNSGHDGKFNVSSKIEFTPSEHASDYEISTSFLKFNTRLKFKKSDIETLHTRNNQSQFYWEDGDDYKSVFISNNAHKTGVLESLNKQTNVNEFLRRKLTSDYDLHSYCFSLNHEDLNIFTSFHEIEVHSFCLITRSIYLDNKGGVFDYNLPNKLSVIQMGSTANRKLGLYFHSETRELFSLTLTNFDSDELSLLLNSMAYYK